MKQRVTRRESAWNITLDDEYPCLFVVLEWAERLVPLTHHQSTQGIPGHCSVEAEEDDAWKHICRRNKLASTAKQKITFFEHFYRQLCLPDNFIKKIQGRNRFCKKKKTDESYMLCISRPSYTPLLFFTTFFNSSSTFSLLWFFVFFSELLMFYLSRMFSIANKMTVNRFS